MRVQGGGLYSEKVQSTHEGRQFQEHGRVGEGRFGGHIFVGSSCGSIILMSLSVKERGPSRSGMTRSGVLRRKAPSRRQQEVTCRREPGRSAMRRILQRSGMKANSPLTLSLTAPWRRSPWWQHTKWRASVPRGSGERPCWKAEHDSLGIFINEMWRANE